MHPERFHWTAAGLGLLAATLLLGHVADGQTAEPTFEVASVRRNLSGEPPAVGRGGPGTVALTRVTLRDLIRVAWRVPNVRLTGGPEWTDSDRFDIVAKANGTPTAEERSLMMRALLADRFKLRVRIEARDMPHYALKVEAAGRTGATLRRSSRDCSSAVRPPDCGLMQATRDRLTFRDVPMRTLAEMGLSIPAGAVVVDRTGLSGTFDVDLTWAPEPRPDTVPSTDAPSIFTAVREQLGLKLEPVRGPVEMLVIESAELPTPD